MSTLDCITESVLRELADPRWFARGEVYYKQARVKDITVDHNGISASVLGTDTYRVRLTCRDDRLTYHCTCPVGQEGNFCKHCVAVGLAFLNETLRKPPATSSLQTFLEKMDHKQLVNLVLSEAERNRRLRDKLEFEEASSVQTGPDLSVFKRAITNATRTGGIDYYSMPRFARRLLEVIDSIRGLLAQGHAGAVVELTEYAFKRLEKAIGQVDDSAGHSQEIIPELTDLHHAACLVSPENPVALAQRLFSFEINSEWDLFSGASANYADVLGKTGLSEYRRLAEAAWSKVPALKPGDDANERFGNRFRITLIMETLACQSEDLQELIAVKQRDLSHPYSFLQIAELYREAGDHDLALQWAEQGAYSFAHVDSRLSDFIAAEYHRRGLHDKAMRLIWEQFVERPGLEAYKHLHGNALQVGKEDWEHWRTDALQFLRERIAASETAEGALPAERISISRPWSSRGDRSGLVEIFLWEGNYDQAWEEATAGGCAGYLWLRLADALAQDHPARAYLVYKELIGQTVNGTNNSAYSEAIKLVKKLHKLTERLNCQSDFFEYLDLLRSQYRRKRNFIQMLDKMRQPL